MTAALLKYRVPRREGTPEDQPPPQALMDAQRALSLVRSHATDWGIDAKRIGILGFSAGGHLGGLDRDQRRSARATSRSTRSTASIAARFRRDLIYPGGVVKKGTTRARRRRSASTSQTPPMFLAHATDDRVSPENSVQLYLALKRAGVPAELHLYATGGHGFGMRPSEQAQFHLARTRARIGSDSQGILKAEKTR